MMRSLGTPQKVLIFRLGSLGDTVVALPAFHLIARSFPFSRRFVLTNLSGSVKDSPVSAIIGNSGLVHGYFNYPLAERSPKRLIALRSQITAWQPDLAIYLKAAHDGIFPVLRDFCFLKLCRVQNVIGVPWLRDQRRHRQINAHRWESEAALLGRRLRELGDAAADDINSFDLGLTKEEMGAADSVISEWAGHDRYIGMSIGGKDDVKEWGDENWRQVLSELGRYFPHLGLALFGSDAEWQRSEDLAKGWSGPHINLCGKLTVRKSAAAMRHAKMFLCHDNGPMHLAASVGVTCVAIFCSRSYPGVWFPAGEKNRIFYNEISCFGCRLEECVDLKKACIMAIKPADVIQTCKRLLLDEG